MNVTTHGDQYNYIYAKHLHKKGAPPWGTPCNTSSNTSTAETYSFTSFTTRALSAVRRRTKYTPGRNGSTLTV